VDRVHETSLVRRLGVIGDIHAQDVLLAATIDAFSRLGVDHIAAVGDIADGRGDLVRCCSLLVQAKATVVRGNHDRWLVEDALRDLPHAHRLDDLDAKTLAFVRALPETATLHSVIGPVLVCHGLGSDDMDRLDPEDHYGISQNPTLPRLRASGVALVVRGHTHRRWAFNFDGLRVVNAGTLETEAGFVIVDLLDDRIHSFTLASNDGGASTIRTEWEQPLHDLPAPPSRYSRDSR